MATPTTIKFSTHPPAAFLAHEIQQESADAASSVLQKNHDEHDFIYTDWGAHNHIVHHITTILALGATPTQITARYNQDASSQRPPPPLDPTILPTLHDRETLLRLMVTKTSLYTTFLHFFTTEISQKGTHRVINEYVFGSDPLSATILMRLNSSFCHPFIHLGCGLEFNQPAIVAEALAQTVCHPGWDDCLWIETREYLRTHEVAKSDMMDIIADMRDDRVLSTAARWEDGQKIRDGVVGRARERLMRQTARWQVDAEDDLEEAAAQMISNFAHYTASALRKTHQINFDFYFLHITNSSLFLTTILQQNWISRKSKAALLTSYGRYGIAIYASRRSPPLYTSEIVQYRPKSPGDWQTLFARACAYEDDGHAAKLVRALVNGEKRCRRYEGKVGFPMEGGMWLQVAHMVMDVVERPGHVWLRSVGFDEAWEERVDRGVGEYEGII